MQSIGDGCYRVLPVFIEDEDVYWDQVLETLDRWGDRRVPKDLSHPMDAAILWKPEF